VLMTFPGHGSTMAAPPEATLPGFIYATEMPVGGAALS
jgi:hypothetical protein